MTEPFGFRNPDGSLRLDELLGERYVQHYTKILTSSSTQFSEMQMRMTLGLAEEDAGPSWSWQGAPPGRRIPQGYLARVASHLPATASACTDVALRPDWCWDVCGYYRRLGVHWRATVRELRIAYNTIDPAQQDDEAFYALTQLLNQQLRQAYDLTELGGVFLPDRSVQADLHRAAAREAAARNAAMHAAGVDYMPSGTQRDVLKEWGLEAEASPEAAAERFLEHAKQRGETRFRPGSGSDALGGSATAWERSWGWWTLTDPACGAEPDAAPEVMEKWQRKVAAALRRSRRGRVPFGVGAWNGNDPITLRLAKEPCIFFLSGAKATRRLAEYAVREAIALGHV